MRKRRNNRRRGGVRGKIRGMRKKGRSMNKKNRAPAPMRGGWRM